MATTLKQLYRINPAPYVAFVAAGLSTSNSFAQMAGMFQKAPGVPDIPEMIKKQLQDKADELLILAKTTLITLVLKGLSEQLQKLPVEKVIKELNKIIDKVNQILKTIEQALEFLKTIFKPLFVFIGILTTLYIVSKVITMIPSFGGGWGFVVTVTAPGQIAQTVMTICDTLLKDLKPVAPGILAAIIGLLGFVTLANTFLGQLNFFLNMQLASKNQYLKTSGMNQQDWSNVDLDTSVSQKSNKDTALDSGMSLSDNLIARIGLSDQISKLESQLSGVGTTPSNVGDCTLPDGSVVKTTPEDCIAQGGIFGYGSPPDNPPAPPSSPYTDASGNVYCWEEPPCEWVCCGGTCFANELVSCTLPSGEVIQATRQDCIAQGGTYPGYDRDGLNQLRNELNKELDNLGGTVSEDELSDLDDDLLEEVTDLFDSLNERIVSTLLNPHRDITVEKITKNFGTRYGFYGQELNENEGK